MMSEILNPAVSSKNNDSTFRDLGALRQCSECSLFVLLIISERSLNVLIDYVVLLIWSNSYDTVSLG